MPKAAKFNFTPERQLTSKEAVSSYQFYVTVSKTSTLFINKSFVDTYEYGGKYMQLFADPEKKAIAWKVIAGKTDLEEVSNARIMTPNIKSGALSISIQKLLKSLGIEKGQLFRRVPVHSYTAATIEGQLSYIILDSAAETKDTKDSKDDSDD